MKAKLIYIDEPLLTFGNGRQAADPRDGLLLYGPYEKWGSKNTFNSYSVAAGVIGTQRALEKYKKFVSDIKRPFISTKRNKRGQIISNEVQRPSYPGFEAVFNVQWPEKPEVFVEIKDLEIEEIFSNNANRRIRTSKLVDLYLEKISKATTSLDPDINIWFVIVNKKIYSNCRSQKGFGKDFKKSELKFFKSQEQGQMSLFSTEELFGEDVTEYLDSSSDFHHLLKARANQERISAPLQIVVEPKLEFRDIERNIPYSDDMKAFLCWSLSTTLYYKLGKRPWKLEQIRPGVCYLGLVFKKFQNLLNKDLVCSAAQLFLDDGDGTVFRGNNGLWIGENEEHHLDEKEASNLLDLALRDYHENNNQTYPTELFIHGRAKFSDGEWSGFMKALYKHGAKTNLVGIVIKDQAPLKFFRDVTDQKGSYGVMRGVGVIISEKEGYLFTRGFVPRLNSSTSMEIPNPLNITITRGEKDIETVLRDVMALTKLNYNACIYGDGKPVTLRFSDTIGSILTATENYKEERRQFRYYI